MSFEELKGILYKSGYYYSFATDGKTEAQKAKVTIPRPFSQYSIEENLSPDSEWLALTVPPKFQLAPESSSVQGSCYAFFSQIQRFGTEQDIVPTTVNPITTQAKVSLFKGIINMSVLSSVLSIHFHLPSAPPTDNPMK